MTCSRTPAAAFTRCTPRLDARGSHLEHSSPTTARLAVRAASRVQTDDRVLACGWRRRRTTSASRCGRAGGGPDTRRRSARTRRSRSGHRRPSRRPPRRRRGPGAAVQPDRRGAAGAGQSSRPAEREQPVRHPHVDRRRPVRRDDRHQARRGRAALVASRTALSSPCGSMTAGSGPRPGGGIDELHAQRAARPLLAGRSAAQKKPKSRKLWGTARGVPTSGSYARRRGAARVARPGHVAGTLTRVTQGSVRCATRSPDAHGHDPRAARELPCAAVAAARPGAGRGRSRHAGGRSRSTATSESRARTKLKGCETHADGPVHRPRDRCHAVGYASSRPAGGVRAPARRSPSGGLNWLR